MADTGSSARQFPAPGSAVPGAPPPLKRALTPADGVSVAIPREPASVASVPDATTTVGGTRFTAAAALLGVAVGLELAGVLSRAFATSRARKMLT
ncbi:hypothetical protein [Mycolicibacterium wolinskyi]|uniref:Uncharacterized protein n=1 Tax=Mycolicibacterium wolinskyi TaxID=59750 RepID=A0A132PGS2_9MYCO|nr:hypothetical protein [Mycolicibacterium wolinskyi]KWX21530.1 hypothetical protein AFM11_25320 [Mycolicibacterium wolinskyi]